MLGDNSLSLFLICLGKRHTVKSGNFFLVLVLIASPSKHSPPLACGHCGVRACNLELRETVLHRQTHTHWLVALTSFRHCSSCAGPSGCAPCCWWTMVTNDPFFLLAATSISREIELDLILGWENNCLRSYHRHNCSNVDSQSPVFSHNEKHLFFFLL